jgi:ATP-dependent Clp protease ATP-binding subunit ClpB
MQPTDPNKFTEKAWSAIARTPDIAKQTQHQHIESEHLLLALLEQEGLATSIFDKLSIKSEQLQERTEAFINSQPKVSGSGSSVYIGKSLDTLLDRADNFRQSYGDDFISIEHLILAYAKMIALAKNYSRNLPWMKPNSNRPFKRFEATKK